MFVVFFICDFFLSACGFFSIFFQSFGRFMMEYLDLIDRIDTVDLLVRQRALRDRIDPISNFSDNEFFDRFRFPKDVVLSQILPLVSTELESTTERNHPAPPIIQLLIALRFYATNDFELTSADLIGFSKTSISRYVHRVTIELAKLYSNFIQLVDASEVPQMYQKFNAIRGMPGVIGTIDCTQVPIMKPTDQDPERFRNRKNIFSINVQVIADADLLIRDVVARWPGSVHDSRIFDNSRVRELFESGRMPRGYLLGDQGYPCRPYLVTPFAMENDRSKQKFNAAHRATRLSIERLFGVWKRTFPCLSKTLRFGPERCAHIVVACAVLWNLRRKLRIPEPQLDDAGSDDEDFEPMRNDRSNRDSIQGSVIRNRICEEYFK